MAAGSIVVDLLLRSGSFETDTDRAAKSLAKLKKEAIQTAKEFGAVLGVATVAAGTALVAMTKQAIDAADGLNKLSQKTGETAETLSGLQYAFELGDVSSEEFGASMAKLARSMSEAAQGSGDTAAAFDVLGVSVKSADGSLRGTGAVLSDVATKFAGYADGAEKTALAQAIFGKSGANLIPVLNAGADGLASMTEEAKRLGIVIDTETAKAAEEFNDTLTKLGKSVDAAGLQMAKDLLPTLQTLADELSRTGQEGSVASEALNLLSSVAEGALKAAALAASALVYLFQEAGRWIGGTAAAIGALATLDIKGFRAISDAVREDSARARAELVAFEQRVLSTGANRSMAAALGLNDIERAAGPLKNAPRLPGSGGKGGGSKSSPRSPDTYADDVAQAVASAITSSDVVKAKELADQIAYLDNLFFKTGLDAEIYESAMRKLTGQTGNAKDATSEFLREQERLADLLGSTASAELERQRDDMKLLAKAYEEGRISVEQYVEAVQSRLGQTGVQAEKTKSLADDLGMTFSSAFEDAIVSGGKFSDVLKGLEQDLIRLITRKAITEPLANMVTSLFSSAGGGGSGGFLNSVGSFFSSIFGGGLANGGPANAGSLYQVNERGSPEMLEMDGKEFLLMGNRRGWVDPNPKPSRSGGTTWSPVFNMSFAAGTSVATATQAGAAVARRIQASAQRNA